MSSHGRGRNIDWEAAKREVAGALPVTLQCFGCMAELGDLVWEVSTEDYPPRLELAIGSKPYPAGGTYRDDKRDGHLAVRALVMAPDARELAEKIVRTVGEKTGLRVIAKNWPIARSLARYELRPKYRNRGSP